MIIRVFFHMVITSFITVSFTQIELEIYNATM